MGKFQGYPPCKIPPVFLVFTWPTNVFDGLPVIWLQALGVYPTPDTLGSSVIFVRKLSSANLNSSIEHLVIFRIFGGRILKRVGPWTWKLFSLKFLTFVVPFVSTGILQSLPSLKLSLVSIPQLGTLPSRIFHVYIILYLSKRLCWDNNCHSINLSQ